MKDLPPPPSLEVVIRTMRSDIERIGETGGTPGEGELVRVPVSGGAVRAPEPEPKPEPTSAPEPKPRQEPSPQPESSQPEQKPPLRGILLIGGGVVLALGLFLAGYFLLVPLFRGDDAPAPEGPQGGLPVAPAPTPEPPPAGGDPPPPSRTGLTHTSFFEDAPRSVLLEWRGGMPFGDALREVAATAAGAETFLEVELVHESGGALSWEEFLSRLGAAIEPGFFSRNFEEDMTVFLHREDDSLFPGYVLRLREGLHPLQLLSGMAQLEQIPGVFTPLFAEFPGAPAGAFEDVQVLGQPVRRFEFTEGVFLYGWFHNKFLVFSTSEEGLRESVRRL